MAKLSKKNKAKWVKALLSGKYIQGAGALCEDIFIGFKNDKEQYEKRYCCLGVACHIRIARAENDAFATDHFLPEDVQSKLAGMNDGEDGKKPKTFKQIAKWIDKNL